ncbi:hypothetical protein [Burkholderia gladioli]|uniref:hypothetical protein n=1 Tax=Burkholderia gladioli TaxID=28095 RepID=UPI00163FA883|nr:hypothetical protein [Burkholderia gladioli]
MKDHLETKSKKIESTPTIPTNVSNYFPDGNEFDFADENAGGACPLVKRHSRSHAERGMRSPGAGIARRRPDRQRRGKNQWLDE